MLRQILAFFILAGASELFAQVPADILKDHFKDYGQDTWNEVPDITVDGHYVATGFQRFPVKLTWSPPNLVRIEGRGAGVRAFDGVIAWRQFTADDLRRMNATEELVLRNSFFAGSPMYPGREHLVFQGLSDMEGVLYYTFMLDESVYKKTFYLDQNDHKLYYVEVETKLERDPVQVLVVYEKYKNYNGLLVPVAVKFEGEDIDEELVYDQFYMGLGAKKSLFSMPGDR